MLFPCIFLLLLQFILPMLNLRSSELYFRGSRSIAKHGQVTAWYCSKLISIQLASQLKHSTVDRVVVKMTVN